MMSKKTYSYIFNINFPQTVSTFSLQAESPRYVSIYSEIKSNKIQAKQLLYLMTLIHIQTLVQI